MENGGEKPKIKEDYFEALVLNKSGKVEYYCDILEPTIVGSPHAIGSGCKFAMGAMLAGKTPREAVKIASRLDPGTNGKIKVISIRK